MQFITTRGTARERGRQHGDALAPLIPQVYQAWVGDAEMRPEGHAVAAWLCERCPDAVEEMAGIAEGAGVAYEQILHLTIRNSLSFLPSGCTTFVVRGDDGRCVLGKTQDVLPVEAQYQLVNDMTDEMGGRAVNIGLVGTVWCVAGMNHEGLCMGCNSAPVLTDAPPPGGLPQHQALYPLLKHHATVDRALRWWLAQPLVGKGINGCLCDRLGDAVTFERAGARHAIVRSTGSLHHTNHYRDPALLAAAGRPGSDNSYERERWLTERISGRTFADPAAEARSLLTDPDGEVCRPFDERGHGSASGYLADPAERTFSVCDGRPSEGEWRVYRLG